MTRTFLHSLDPPSAGPFTGPTVNLDVADIENAGIRSAFDAEPQGCGRGYRHPKTDRSFASVDQS